jgi:hypothetical protein
MAKNLLIQVLIHDKRDLQFRIKSMENKQDLDKDEWKMRIISLDEEK